MTRISKRALLKTAGWSALAAAAALAGCGKKEEAAPAAATEPASAASVAAAKPEPLKVAWLYIGPVGDGGWTFAHDNGRKAVEKEFGDRVITTFVEKGDSTTCSRRSRGLARSARSIGQRRGSRARNSPISLKPPASSTTATARCTTVLLRSSCWRCGCPDLALQVSAVSWTALVPFLGESGRRTRPLTSRMSLKRGGTAGTAIPARSRAPGILTFPRLSARPNYGS